VVGSAHCVSKLEGSDQSAHRKNARTGGEVGVARGVIRREGRGFVRMELDKAITHDKGRQQKLGRKIKTIVCAGSYPSNGACAQKRGRE